MCDEDARSEKFKTESTAGNKEEPCAYCHTATAILPFVFGVQSQLVTVSHKLQSQSQYKMQFRQSSAGVIKITKNTKPRVSSELPKPQPNVGKTAAATWRFENELT